MEQAEKRQWDETDGSRSELQGGGRVGDRGSEEDKEERRVAATKLQSRQRGRAQRSRYQTKLAAQKLRRRRLPAFVNVYVEAADGKQKIDAAPLARFGGRYDRVDEVDGRRVKGAKVAHYTVRADPIYVASIAPSVFLLRWLTGCAVYRCVCVRVLRPAP
jgi:hypothetical protein